MARLLGSFVVAVVLSLAVAIPAAAQKTSVKSTAQSDAQIKQDIIRESIASYAGSCPCPYNTDRRGRSCGRRSAYSRPGGASPVCYQSDVTAKMVADYRAIHGEKAASIAKAKNTSK